MSYKFQAAKDWSVIKYVGIECANSSSLWEAMAKKKQEKFHQIHVDNLVKRSEGSIHLQHENENKKLSNKL